MVTMESVLIPLQPVFKGGNKMTWRVRDIGLLE